MSRNSSGLTPISSMFEDCEVIYMSRNSSGLTPDKALDDSGVPIYMSRNSSGLTPYIKTKVGTLGST